MGAETTEFRILGPLEAERDDQPLALGGPKQRAVLAGLLLNAGRVVSRDRLIEIVWGERPPETAAAALQGYVAGLRKTIGAERILTRPPGYVLEVDPTSVDLTRFEALLRQGKDELHAGNPGAALSWLTEALDLWRGDPLVDLDSGPAVTTERLRLHELRLGATEERVEAELALGQHIELVAELQTLVREHPLRERLCGQLMLALYRSDRQAEALEVYRECRRRLTGELGLEPGEALKRLERGILEHDPALGPVDTPTPTPASRRSGRRRGLLAVLATIALVGAAIGTAFALTGGSSRLEARPDSVAVVDPTTDRLVDDVRVGGRPVAVAVGEGGVWVADADDRTVVRIDPTTRTVVRAIGIGSDVRDLAVGFGAVWVANGWAGTVTRLDPKTGSAQTIRVGSAPVFWVATGAGGVWTTSGTSVVRIDPSIRRPGRRIDLLLQPTGLAAGLGAVWVTTWDELLFRVSPRGVISPTRASFDGNVVAPTVGNGYVWVIYDLGHGIVQSIDPGALEFSSGTDTSAYPLDVAVGRSSVWAVDVSGNVLRINPTTAEVVAKIPTAPTARSSIAVGSGAVWVAIQQPA